jgi:putative transposase
MSYVRIWCHCVWSTKNWIPYLREPVRDKVINHIRENARMKGIFLIKLNGYTDHLHGIVSLGPTQTIAGVMQSIKGESSFWINRNKLTERRFEWQDDYWAVSVGDDHIERLSRYIKNQVEHHSKETLDDELKRLSLDYFKDVSED